MTLPPRMPTKSLMTVSTGSITSAAMTRGVTSFLIGSVPSVLRASICSVTRIEPIWAAMPEPTRPATMRPASTGPSWGRAPRAHASGHHETRQHGTQLADHRAGDESTDVRQGAELLQLD